MLYHEYDDFSIIPIKYRDKRPYGKLLPKQWDPLSEKYRPTWEPYQERRATPKERERWFKEQCNLGVIGGKISNNLAIVDFDSQIAYDAWSAEYKDFPTVKTAKGYHVWVQYGKSNVPGNTDIALADAPKIKVGEIRGEGGYGVAPPSIHASGNPYEWILGGPKNLPVIPNFQFLGIIPYSKPRLGAVKVSPDLSSYDNDIATRIYEKALERHTPGDRNNTGFWLACQLRDNQVPYEQAISILELYQSTVPQGKEPYTVQEAHASVRSAYKTHHRDPWSIKKNIRNPVQELDSFISAFGKN